MRIRKGSGGLHVARYGVFGQYLHPIRHAGSAHTHAAKLREFVNKNTFFPRFFSEIDSKRVERHDQTIRVITNAIHHNQFDDSVFQRLVNDGETPSYILYLIENEKIPLWQGVSLYQFMMIAAQFSSPELLSPDDQDVFSPRHYTLKRLVDNGKLTNDARQYLHKICKSFNALMPHQLQFDELAAFVVNSPVIEQYVMECELKNPRKHQSFVSFSVDYMLSTIVSAVPFFQANGSDAFVYPSSTLVNFLFSKMSVKPVSGRPILGSVSDATRLTMLKMNEHPIPLYNRDVFSNVKLVHNRRIGPVAGIMHDWAHIYWASLLKPEERYFILQRMQPALVNLAKPYSHCLEYEISTTMEQICRRLTDFELSSKAGYPDPETRLATYIMNVINTDLLGINTDISAHEKKIVLSFFKSVFASEAKVGELTPSLESLKVLIHELLAATDDEMDYLMLDRSLFEDTQNTVSSRM